MSTCPSGHATDAADYCDVCGLPIDADGGAAAETGAPATDPGDTGSAAVSDSGAAICPNCQEVNPPNALFCEACGYDFTTGSMPRPMSPPSIESVLDLPAAAEPAQPTEPEAARGGPLAPSLAEPWVAEIWIDPDWYAEQESSDPLPSAGVPTVVALRTRSILVGRASRSRAIHPDIDLGTDNGISRRHCQLTTDGTRWWVEDLGSSNGTYVGSSVGALPEEPVPPGERREIGVDERLYLGAWTRIVVRRATPGEI